MAQFVSDFTPAWPAWQGFGWASWGWPGWGWGGWWPDFGLGLSLASIGSLAIADSWDYPYYDPYYAYSAYYDPYLDYSDGLYAYPVTGVPIW